MFSSSIGELSVQDQDSAIRQHITVPVSSQSQSSFFPYHPELSQGNHSSRGTAQLCVPFKQWRTICTGPRLCDQTTHHCSCLFAISELVLPLPSRAESGELFKQRDCPTLCPIQAVEDYLYRTKTLRSDNTSPFLSLRNLRARSSPTILS